MTCSTMRRVLVLALVTCSALVVSQPHAQVPAQPKPEESRGALLYTTHCVACHTTQMHWRADRLAYDWDSLQFQVRRWQGNAGLQWADADITEVARYLNQTIYKYPQTTNRVGLMYHPTLQSIQSR